MPDILVKVGSIVLLLGGLIFVHELGHFLVAKALRVKVLRFSIGFGPRLFWVQRGETEYRISALPLGGYVKMAGDDPSETLAPEDRGRGFLEQAPWKRLLIAVAGPTANLVFPAVIYLALILAQNGKPAPGPFAGTIVPGSAADVAGLRPGDRILTVAERGGPARQVRYFSDLPDLISPHIGEPLALRVEREGEEIGPLTIVPTADEERNPIETTRRGVIGVTPMYTPATVAPVRRGAAGPVEPFDLVIRAGDRPIRHFGELSAALARAACGPLDLEVVREYPLEMPGAALSQYRIVKLPAVPTCADGKPALAAADQAVSVFIARVAPGSPAERAGVRRGDAVAAMNGRRVTANRDVDAVVRDLKASTPVKLDLADGRTVTFLPAAEKYVDDLTREEKGRLTLGISPYRNQLVDPRVLLVGEVPLDRGPVEAAALAGRELKRVVRLTVLGIAAIATGKISAKALGGPIMLFSIASEAAEEGWSTFLFQMALISVNLGLMNLLPIPVLDGGHIAQAALEGVTRRPLTVRSREIANIVGLILLFTLMLFVFKNDIVRLMG